MTEVDVLPSAALSSPVLSSAAAGSKLGPRTLRKLRIGEWAFLACTISLGLVLRLDFLLANSFVIDGDEAIVGLMAKHVLEGSPWPVFYYGQHYMGSFEALLVALSFRLFGMSPFALKLVPLLFSLALIPIVYAGARRLGGDGAARLAALLIAIPPSPLVVWSAMARGGFIEVLVLGAIALYLTQLWLAHRNRPALVTMCIGLVLGLGWWINNQIIFFMCPIALCMGAACIHEARHRAQALAGRFARAVDRVALHGAIGAVAFVIGGAPFWIYNLNHDFVSFEMFGAAPSEKRWEQIGGLFSTALPIIFGAQRFWHSEEIFWGSSVFAYVLYGALFAVMAWLCARSLLRIVAGIIDERTELLLYLMTAVTCIAVFSASSFGWLVQAPRYLLPLYVPLSVLSAVAVAAISSRASVMGAIVASALFFLNITSSYLGGRAIPGEPHVFNGERVSKDHRELIRWLDEKDISVVRTNYWIGYRLAFETAERVVFSVFGEPHRERIAWQESSLALEEAEELLPLVLVPSEADIVRNALDVLGIRFAETERSGYRILYDLRPVETELLPLLGGMTAESSHAPASAPLGIDGGLETRWGSGAHQTPGMVYTVRLSEPAEVRGIRYHLGNWWHDYPRALEVFLVSADGAKSALLKSQDWQSVRYYLGGADVLTLRFPPRIVSRIELHQVGSDPVFDWSIAELEVLD